MSASTGDRSKEDKVDDNLLIRVRHVFRWSGDSNSESSPEEYPVRDYNGTVGTTYPGPSDSM